MRQQTRSRVANCLDRAHLLRPAERLRQGWLTIRAHDDHLAFDGLPVPPARQRLLVDGRSGDAAHFLRVGRRMYESIRDAVAASGTDPRELRAVLDFGCGCGRVARHWARLDGPEIYGCDYNPDLTSWCERNLPFLRVARNRLAPPTPYVSGSFDLVYALSVFSHLDDPLQRLWLDEYRRLLRLGGLLVLSLLGDSLRFRLDPVERRRYDAGDLVVQRPAPGRPQPVHGLPPAGLRLPFAAGRLRRRPPLRARHAGGAAAAGRLHRPRLGGIPPSAWRR